MNEGKYNNQALNEYLLGSLPEAETERFDELVFTDEEFAAALASAEKDLVDAYVQDELAGETLEKFKSFYLASPLRREKVEFARAFQVFAERNHTDAIENSGVRKSETKQTASGFFSRLNVFTNKNPRLGWGLAVAVLALVFLGGWAVVNNRFNRQETQIARQGAPAQVNQTLPPLEKERLENSNAEATNKENQPSQKKTGKEETNKQPVALPTPKPKQSSSPMLPRISVASFILAPPVRSSQIPSLSIPKETVDVAIQLQLESDDYASYRVALVDQAGRNLWRSGALKTKNKGGGKTLTIRIPAKILQSQVYSLAVSGTGADGASEIISNYPFRSVLK